MTPYQLDPSEKVKQAPSRVVVHLESQLVFGIKKDFSLYSK